MNELYVYGLNSSGVNAPWESASGSMTGAWPPGLGAADTHGARANKFAELRAGDLISDRGFTLINFHAEPKKPANAMPNAA